jgi:hypothetical protein
LRYSSNTSRISMDSLKPFVTWLECCN